MERSTGRLVSRALLRLGEADVWVKLAFVNFERRDFIFSVYIKLVCSRIFDLVFVAFCVTEH